MRFEKIKDLTVSKIALGTWGMGGGADWGPCDTKQAEETIFKALELGINTIDCAPIYGLGASEELLGRTLKGKRDKIVLATKCGLTPAPRAVKRDLSKQAVLAEVEASLKRLQTDYIDIYFIHWPDRNTPLQETLDTMRTLKEQGKIRLLGVSNFDSALLEQAIKNGGVDCVQNQYSFLNRAQGQDVFELCKKHNIAFFAYGPLGGGILGGGYKKEPNLPNSSVRSFFYKFYKGDAFGKAQKAAQKLKAVAQHHNASAAQAAINWTLYNPVVTCALAGARKPLHIADTAAAADWQITPQEMDFLENENN